MKDVLEYLSRHREPYGWGDLVKLLVILAVLATLAKVCYDGAIAFHKSAYASTAAALKERKNNCTGEFDTIPCHQLKIEHLLRESHKQRTEQ